MSKKHVIMRIILLILVTIVFMGAFYVFFKNSRASTPYIDREYMEQLRAASNGYQTAGTPLVSPTPIPFIPEDKQNVISVILKALNNLLSGNKR